MYNIRKNRMTPPIILAAYFTGTLIKYKTTSRLHNNKQTIMPNNK